MSVETSIIIRTLNEAKYLERLLMGIREQSYQDWEIILVDSGSTDATLDIGQRYGARIYHIPQEEFTFGRSLNLGCRIAQGRYLVFASGHVWPVNNSWLRYLVKPFEEPSVAMVYGRQRGTEANSLSELRDLSINFGRASRILVHEPDGNNGNAAIRRELWVSNPFDESLPGQEDVDWASKVQRKGFRVYYASDASVYHVHEESLKVVYRRYMREAIAHKRMFPRYRFTWTDMAKGLSYAIARDFLYALRHRKLRKVFQIPGTRLAEFLGTHRGVRYQKQLSREVVRRLVIPARSQSVVIEGPGHHGLRETEVPQLGPEDALIQVAYVGVCATDLEVANGHLDYYRKGVAHYPISPGHEYSGIVARKGADVHHLRTGQKVVVECAVGCGQCSACAVGEYYRCHERQETGVINRSGAYGQYLVMPSKYLHKLPVDMSLKHGALVEPIAVCLKGLHKLCVDPGHEACVVGAGSLGNLCAQILRSWGVHVTSVDPDPRRLDLLHKYDIDTLAELGPLDKYDYLVEASGNEDVLPHLIESSKPSVKLLLLGLPYSRPIQAGFSTVTSYDKLIIGSVASRSRDWGEAIRIVHSGEVSLDDHTAVVEPLENYRKAWNNLETREHFKVLLTVSKELEAL